VNVQDEDACIYQSERNFHGRTTDALQRLFPSWPPHLTCPTTYQQQQDNRLLIVD